MLKTVSKYFFLPLYLLPLHENKTKTNNSQFVNKLFLAKFRVLYSPYAFDCVELLQDDRFLGEMKSMFLCWWRNRNSQGLFGIDFIPTYFSFLAGSIVRTAPAKIQIYGNDRHLCLCTFLPSKDVKCKIKHIRPSLLEAIGKTSKRNK